MKRILFLVLLFACTVLKAEIRLPQVLSSNMVIQRNSEARIWGWASPGEKIFLSFRGQVVKTKADKSGQWLLKFPSGEAGGPFNMSIKGKKEIILDNILVGDVWVCSGQSNMEWPLKRAANGEAEASKADFPNIRFFYVQQRTSMLPLDDVGPAQWQVCSPKSAPDFSAVGYFFGKKVHLETGVPIGLINTSWGGTMVETWTSREAAETDPVQKKWLEGLQHFDAQKMAGEQAQIFKLYREELSKVQVADYRHDYLAPEYNDNNWFSMTQPGLWEDHPGFEGFDGIVWYRKTIEVPENFNVNKAVLHLGKIDDTDWVWINGKRVGETFNQYAQARRYEIPGGIITTGNNTIVVRIEDYTGGGGIYGLEEELLLSDGTNSIPLSGLWKVAKDPVRTPRNPLVLQPSALQPNQFPTLLFNAMIHPLVKFAIKGAIWYQGEANADAVQQALRYEKQFQLMISDWRKHWQVGDFPFYWVQLANFKAETQKPRTECWPFLREAQANTLGMKNTGQACIIDIGEANDIHPRNKVDVGSRLALNALRFDYGKEVVYHGPRKGEVAFKGNQAIVSFETGGGPLMVKNKYGYINGFAVAGKDKVFHYAAAEIVDDRTVKVSSRNSDPIEAVRFLWADNPGEANLYNNAGLPAEPFRTDNWNDK